MVGLVYEACNKTACTPLHRVRTGRQMPWPGHWKWPAGHAVHCSVALSPLALLCVPGGHGSAAEAPGAQYEPGGQTWHSVLPLSFMNVPALQGSHVTRPTELPTVPREQS